jgi:cell division initiation protein
MSELSPLDILGKTFSKRLHGWAPQEVQEFLIAVASAMEGLLRERGELRQQVHRLQQDLSSFQARENALQDALVAAQRSAESTVGEARAEGQRILAEAQTLADRLVEDAHQRAQNVETVISDLRSRRREVRAELMRLVELLQGMVRDDRQLEHDAPAAPQLAVLRRPHSDASGSKG